MLQRRGIPTLLGHPAASKMGKRSAQLLLLLPAYAGAQVRRPAALSHAIGFEGLTTNCDFAASKAPLSDEFAEKDVAFSGPGFGKPLPPNGGVPMDGCALSSGMFPPLGNGSFDGSGFLGFSTLHAFNDRTGKPIAPETIVFEQRMTNIIASFAGIDGHPVNIELWSGPGRSHDDAGEVLQSFSFTMSAQLTPFKLVDENDIYVDCVRRMVVSSPSKIFILDNLIYDVTSADDSICGIEPGRQAPAGPPPPKRFSDALLDRIASSGATARARDGGHALAASVLVASSVAFLCLQNGTPREQGAQRCSRTSRRR